MTATERHLQTPDDTALRHMIRYTIADGWESPAGRRLLVAVSEHAGRWAPAIERHCHLDRGTVEPQDLVTQVWHILHRWPQRVLDAAAPWAYLWNAVRNATSVAFAAAAVGSTALAEKHLRLCRTIPPPLRVGHSVWKLDRAVGGSTPRQGSCDRWSPALRRLLDLLVEVGADRDRWADAIDRAVEVMADARRSYEEFDLRRDPYLSQTLGLYRKQLCALGALLVGPRCGDRAEQSLLLALHRDIDTSPAEVPGAEARIRLLLDLDRAARPGARTEECTTGLRTANSGSSGTARVVRARSDGLPDRHEGSATGSPRPQTPQGLAC